MKNTVNRVFRHNEVIIDLPSLVLDVRHSKDCFQRAHSMAEGLDQWVLLCIPDASVSITPEAADHLASMLDDMDKTRCLGIYILTSTINTEILRHALECRVDGAGLFSSQSIVTICERIESVLDNKKVFS